MLGLALAVAGGSGSAAAKTPLYGDPLVTVAGLDLQTVTIPQLEAAMAKGRLTSRQLTQAYLNRIAFYDHGCVQVNAIRTLTDDALAQADAADRARRAGRTGPLLGIPILLKDNIDTTDADTTAGSIALAGNRPPKDAVLTARLRAAGAVILGKTNLSEFANWMEFGMPNGYSTLGGQVLDPYDQNDPLGSSSGSGAGGTLAFAAATFGTETSGSVLAPSAANSMVGIKPTVGLISRSGIIPLAHSFDTAGPIARDVTDAAVLLTAVNGPDPNDVINTPAPGAPTGQVDYTAFLDPNGLKGARIGYSPQDLSQGTTGGVLGTYTDGEQALFLQALADMQAAGATLVPFDTFSDDSNAGLSEFGGIPSEFKFGINDYLAHEAGPAGPGGRPVLTTDDLSGIIVYNQQHPAVLPYGEGRTVVGNSPAVQGQDLLVASDATAGATQDDPSSAVTLTTERASIDTAFAQNDIDAYIGGNFDYANLGAAAGYPSIEVPVGYAMDPNYGHVRPFGVQILGRAWSEPTLIRLAYSFEQIRQRRVPPTVMDPALVSCKTTGSHTSTGAAAPAAAPSGAAAEAAPAAAGAHTLSSQVTRRLSYSDAAGLTRNGSPKEGGLRGIALLVILPLLAVGFVARRRRGSSRPP